MKRVDQLLALSLLLLLCCSQSWRLAQISPRAFLTRKIGRRSSPVTFSRSRSLRPAPFLAMRMTANEDFEQPDGECQHSSAEYADGSSLELTDDLILPKHPSLIEGHLENGLKYLVVPNNFPRGRFEAHLEILSGSINELESQQGMAHLLEHIAYMGSPKRQLISGTGSRTNGYTDFHHTVFYAACPTISPDAYRKRPMLPMALDALLDVLQTVVDDERLEKERAAVLSEASMVNTMDYRVECQLLSALHRENRIGRRFPIGKEAQIRAWTREEVQRYHATHYRPDNAVLYLVGDLGDQPAAVLGLIRDKFGPLAPLPAAERQALEASGEFPRPSMKEVHRHYPPVAHRWSLSPARAAQLLPAHLAVLADPPEPDPSCPIKPAHTSLIDPVSPAATLGSSGNRSSGEELTTALTAASRLFKHELVQAVSFHLFAKRPIEPLTSAGALRRELARRLVLTALTVRLNVLQRQAPLFTLADVACLAWVREGCTVCSLDLTTDLPRWRQAVQLAVREVRRMGRYGLTASELLRYKQSLLSEIGQLLAQAEQQPHEEVLNELMEAEAVGHTFMEPRDRFGLVSALLQDLGREEVAQVGRELCEHLSHCDPTAGVVPAAIVASCPLLDRDGQPTSAVSEAELVAAVREVLEEAVEPPQETTVPERILADEEVQRKIDALRPHWLEPNPNDLTNPSKPTVSREDLAQRTLSNGLRVNLKSLVDESQEVRVRLFVPGGRLLEDPVRPGAMLLAARTMQEGGAFSQLSREEVELFCIDHAIAVEIKAVEDALLVDLHALTVPGPGKVVSGVEGALQVAHVLLTDFLFEQDAFLRAQQALHEQSDSAAKGLEAVCREQLLSTLTAGDGRLLTPSHGQLDAIGLDEVRSLVHGLLRPENVEISISGDLPLPALEALALRYLGTVPSSPNPSNPNPSLRLIQESLRVRALGREQQLRVHLTDSDERAMGYVAGPAPNRFGQLADGRSLSELLAQAPGLGPRDQERRRHPLFGYAVLQLIQEVANRRLFSVVREERRLTYDASFQFEGRDIRHGGYFVVSVTSPPATVQAAVGACKEALRSLLGPFGVLGDSLQAAKRSIQQRVATESLTNLFWLDLLAGSQADALPAKNLPAMLDFPRVVAEVSLADLQQALELLGFREEEMTVCVGLAAPVQAHAPAEPDGLAANKSQQVDHGPQPSVPLAFHRHTVLS